MKEKFKSGTQVVPLFDITDRIGSASTKDKRGIIIGKRPLTVIGIRSYGGGGFVLRFRESPGHEYDANLFREMESGAMPMNASNSPSRT